MNVEKRKLTDITVSADRVREDPGDLSDLKASMAERGLINPVTITADGDLIAGFRRLSAARELGWEEIDCHVWHQHEAVQLLATEVEENPCRQPFTYAEAERAWRRHRVLLGLPEEPERYHRPRTPAERASQEAEVPERARKAATVTGYGVDVLRRVQAVRKAAEDTTLPPAVRQVAQQEYGRLETQTNRGKKAKLKGPGGALQRIEAARRAAAGEPEPETGVDVGAGPDGTIQLTVNWYRPRVVNLSPDAARDLASAILGQLERMTPATG